MDSFAIVDLVVDLGSHIFLAVKPNILLVILRTLYLLYDLFLGFDEITVILKGLWLYLGYVNHNIEDCSVTKRMVIDIIYFVTFLGQLMNLRARKQKIHLKTD